MIDPLFAGTSKTKLLMVFWVIESGSRFIMLIFLIQGLRLGVIAVAYAQLAGLLSKGILGVYFCRKEITQPKMHFWQVWIAPFVAGFLNFIVLFILDIFLDDMLIILFGFIFPFSVYVIISAWLGSWDENQIKEYTRAKDISKKGLKPILSMFLGSAKIGMKIPSPFSGKFKIDIWEDAQREIEELEAMRKELIM
ncbi:MAG: hypothetical protein GY870_11445 [archaeon]|nr:hypothetical protein [archaeon]